jgi:hypothetical protein
VKARSFRVVLPKPKPKKDKNKKPCGPRTTVACQLDRLTPPVEPEPVDTAAG